MAKPIARIRAHHAEILKKLKRIPQIVAGIKADSVDASREALDELVSFLEDDLRPHAEGEEQFLYPAVDDLVKRYERATATMSLDHVTITEEIEAFRTRTEKLLELTKSKADTEEIVLKKYYRQMVWVKRLCRRKLPLSVADPVVMRRPSGLPTWGWK